MEGRKKGYNVGWSPPPGIVGAVVEVPGTAARWGCWRKVFFLLNFGEFWHNDDGLYRGFRLISFGEFSAAYNVFCGVFFVN